VDDTGTNVNVLAEVNGHPAIAYWQSNFLKYARAVDPLGEAWNPPVLVDKQRPLCMNSLAVVNGRPAIAYYDNRDGAKLLFVRANDADGGSWGDSLVIADAFMPDPDQVARLTLMVVAGNPAIAFEGADGWNVSYIRALDADGNNWDSPTGIAQTTYNSSCAMVEADGKPAICYWDEETDTLRWVRAVDAAGEFWRLPVTIAGVPMFVGVAAAVVAGVPAVAFMGSEGHCVLRYSQAVGIGGDEWLTPVDVATSSGAAGWPLIVSVGGRPAIAYLEIDGSGRSRLMYVRSSRADGAAWGDPKAIQDLTPSGGGTTLSSMALIGEHPALSYMYVDRENDIYELRFAIYY